MGFLKISTFSDMRQIKNLCNCSEENQALKKKILPLPKRRHLEVKIIKIPVCRDNGESLTIWSMNKNQAL